LTVSSTSDVCVAVVPDPFDEDSGMDIEEPMTTAPTAIPATTIAKAIARTFGDAKAFRIHTAKP